VELGYARVSTAKQDLDRQIEALVDTGVARERIYVDTSIAADSRPSPWRRCAAPDRLDAG